MKDLSRLLKPKSIAVIGGGHWCESVVRENLKIGFGGPIWPIHPKRKEIAGCPTHESIDDLPEAPDAVFIGVNREATVSIVRKLSAMGSGGAVCFASGFSEAEAEIGDGNKLQAELLQAAGRMPILGPNCYGFLNAMDHVALWPDQHGLQPVERGVALIMQSSNVALNLTMQQRGLPIAYAATIGNQAQIDMATLATSMLQDPRVTALGLFIEGIDDIRRFEAMTEKARQLGKPIAAIKLGASEQAVASAFSHTASLTGTGVGANALFKRLGIGQVEDPAVLVELLKLLHVNGPLTSNRIAAMSCSGGEAGLMADMGLATGLTFPPLNSDQESALRHALGPKVSLANPLDYHTYIWGKPEALHACFSAMVDENLSLTCVVLDFPRSGVGDASGWQMVADTLAEIHALRAAPVALISTLSENIPEDVARSAIDRGVIPLNGAREGMTAISVAIEMGTASKPPSPILLPGPGEATKILSEADAKRELSKSGVAVPRSKRARSIDEAVNSAAEIGFPVVLKGEGLAHKSDAGGVMLNLVSAQSVEEAARSMPFDTFLVEEMISDGTAELLVGVIMDPAHGFVLTIGAGGVLTELIVDAQSLLLPVTCEDIEGAIDRLRIAPVLDGYRGAPAANKKAIIEAVLSVQSYVIENAEIVHEIEINPLICTPDRAVAADALIRLREKT